eukprot:CAMPEP_0118836378 /NCGR_PEP_ID=MMETSP1162-20130426/58335_1 /TAXON_ID=33656 /ORGANISM="Phaeocystis Sp, Strain CCMP2710" /LENGTH=48 /DNA_ID= /DNA_START= /DNA_END= /DNA_ORIENTATION=
MTSSISAYMMMKGCSRLAQRMSVSTRMAVCGWKRSASKSRTMCSASTS